MVKPVHRDEDAGELLKRLREARGLSPEQLSHALYGAGLERVSGQTIRRIERHGAVPQVRVRFALAKFFEREVVDIWQPKRKPRGRHATSRRMAA